MLLSISFVIFSEKNVAEIGHLCYTAIEVIFVTTGELIRQARKKLNWTQKKLGEEAGIAEPTIRRYELGKLNPKYETLQKIADALGTAPAALMGNYTSDELIDLYIRGAKIWATDFRFSDEQKNRISELLAEYALRIKQLINTMAETAQIDGKIPLTPTLQSELDSISTWVANSLKYVNNDYSDDPQV